MRMPPDKEFRVAAELSTLDDLLAEDGTPERFQAAAIEEVIAWQIEQAMKEQKELSQAPR